LIWHQLLQLFPVARIYVGCVMGEALGSQHGPLGSTTRTMHLPPLDRKKAVPTNFF
jgi:hypothetical protein